MTELSYPATGEAVMNDLASLLELYRRLHPMDPIIEIDDSIRKQWKSMLDTPMLRQIVARDGERVVSACTLVIVPNLTRGARPYGLIENVVTDPNWRRRGIGTAVLRYALNVAWTERCYKVMLMTGSNREETLRFYEKAGFVRGEKTGFIAKPPIV